MRPIIFTDYDKLTDVVYSLGSKTVLELVVSLSRKNDTTFDRYHFHKEFKYPSKYAQGGKMCSIKRHFEYYLVLTKTDSSEGSGVMMRVQDMYLILLKMKEALRWFESGIFGMRSKSKELYIKIKQNSILISDLPAGKYLQFDPIVIVYENTGTQAQGIRITLGNPSVYADVSIDRFYGLYYILSNMDIFSAAQNLVNYLGRPEYGTNMREYDMDSFVDIVEERDDMTSGIKDNREILATENQKHSSIKSTT